MLGTYYYNKFGVDFRCIKYPGVISSDPFDFNGASAYASEIFFAAVGKAHYKCFLKPDTKVPYCYVEDTIRGTM